MREREREGVEMKPESNVSFFFFFLCWEGLIISSNKRGTKLKLNQWDKAWETRGRDFN